VYAAGDNGTLLHYDGAAWKPVASGTTRNLYGVWADDEAFAAVGAEGTFIVGRRSSGMTLGGPRYAVQSIPRVTAQDLRAMWGTSSNSLVAVSAGADALFFDGKALTKSSVENAGSLSGVQHGADGRTLAVSPEGSMFVYSY
jgi:hypothetical protein